MMRNFEMKRFKMFFSLLMAFILLLSAACTTGGGNENQEDQDHEHSYVWTTVLPATCTKDGERQGVCSCGDIKTETITALGHDYGDWEETVPPTCTEKGEEKRFCSHDNSHTNTRKTTVLKHEFTDYVPDGNATYYSDGTKTAFCKYGCGTTDTITDAGSKLTFVHEELSKAAVNSFSAEYVNIYGRTYFTRNTTYNKDMLMLDHCATAIEFGIVGQSLSAKISSVSNMFICIYVDDVLQSRYELNSGKTNYDLLDGLTDDYHRIRIVKSNESANGSIGIIELDAAQFATVPKKPELKIEFIGDSITTGCGITGDYGSEQTLQNSDATKAFAYVAAEKLGADYSVVAVTGICVNTIMWTNYKMNKVYKQVSTANSADYGFDFGPDVVVINLGTNDATYIQRNNAAYADAFPTDYYDFLKYVRERNPNAYIVCIYGMMGEDHRVSNGITSAISRLKSETNDERIVRFTNYTANTSGCKGHPTAGAQKTFGTNLANYIRKLIG